MGKARIVVTYDDIIEYTSYDLYLYLRENIVTYNKFLDIYRLEDKKTFYSRDKKNVIEYLGIIEKIKQKYGEKNLIDILGLFYSILLDGYYNKTPKIITTSKLASNGIGNILFTHCHGIEEIVVLIKYRTENEKKYKINITRSYIDNAKIVCLKSEEDYYKCFKDIPQWNLVVTEDVDLVENLAAEKIDHAEFLIPEYGYNKIKPELVELIKLKDSSISSYKIE